MNTASFIPNLQWSPWKQAGIILAIDILFILACLIFQLKGRTPWMLMQAPVLFFCCMNVMMGVFRDKISGFYYLFSIISFLIIVSLSVVFSKLISGEGLNIHRDFYTIIGLNTLFYFMILMISVLFRGIKYMLEHMDD